MFIDTLGTAYPTESSQTNSEKDLGKDTFLKLLVAQMENQDPLNPMEGTEFTAQLAQYSSLEQLYNVNDNLLSIQGGQTALFENDMLDFMGKEIFISGDELNLEQGASASGGFSIDASADCTVTIFDSEGQVVKSISMGNLESGKHTFEWDGLDLNEDAMERGLYRFEISAVGDNGAAISVETYVFGKVDRVSLGGGIPMLYVNGSPVAISEIVDIRLPSEN
jgi:flagellar basal-body rod modification protein FlgD